LIELSAQAGWRGALYPGVVQPIPTGCRFKQAPMLPDFLDLRADCGGRVLPAKLTTIKSRRSSLEAALRTASRIGVGMEELGSLSAFLGPATSTIRSSSAPEKPLRAKICRISLIQDTVSGGLHKRTNLAQPGFNSSIFFRFLTFWISAPAADNV
jgi:hypothetical protein